MKRLMLLLLAVLLMMPAMAQSLPGTWVTTETMDEDSDGFVTKALVTDQLVMSADNSFRESGDMKMTIGKDDLLFSFTIVFSGGGTWKRDGETLSIQYNSKLAKAELTDCDLPAVLKLMIANAAVKEVKKGLSSKKPDIYQIQSLTDTQLVLLDPESTEPGHEIQTFTRK